MFFTVTNLLQPLLGMNIAAIKDFLFYQRVHQMTVFGEQEKKVFSFVCAFIMHSSGTARIVKQERLPFCQKPLMCKLTLGTTDVFCLSYPIMNGCSLILIDSQEFPLGNQAFLTSVNTLNIPAQCLDDKRESSIQAQVLWSSKVKYLSLIGLQKSNIKLREFIIKAV